MYEQNILILVVWCVLLLTTTLWHTVSCNDHTDVYPHHNDGAVDIFNYSTSSDKNNGSFFYHIGDKYITKSKWDLFLDTIHCWTSSDGDWVKYDKPIYDTSNIINNDENLISKVYGSILYQWTPSNVCTHPLSKFNRNEVCRLMRGRTLVFIGDSLSLHHYETTLTAIGERTVFSNHTDGHHHSVYTQPYTYCEKLKKGLNYNVTYLSWNKIDNQHAYVSLQKTCELQHNPYGCVIVANWGAFYVPDETLKVHMHKFISFLDTHLASSTFIFRSSTMAHEKCSTYEKPDGNVHLPVPGPRKHWQWDKFPYQSHYIWQPFLTHHHPGKIFMNVFDMMTKRPDGHVGKNEYNSFEDCLHYCIPGPFDSFVILTFSILELIEDMTIPDKYFGSPN